MSRVLLLTVDPPADVTHFRVQASNDRETWTGLYVIGSGPATDDLAVALLSSGVYTLDGLNTPAGNKAAIAAMRWFQVQHKTSGGYGSWGKAFLPRQAVRTAYPTESDLAAFLDGLGLTLTAAQDLLLEDAIAAAIAQFEGPDGANRVMLAGDAETRYYDPPDTSNSVLFPEDLASVTSIAYQPAGSSAQTLTLNEDYWLEPHNAAAKGKPYTMVRFRRSWSLPLSAALRRSILITGRFGYATELPAAAWQGMLAAGALQLANAIRYKKTGGVLSWKQGDRSVDYGTQAWQDVVKGWESTFAAGVKTYRKISFG